MNRTLIGSLVCLAASAGARTGAEAPLRDVVYATAGSHELKLNLFLPEATDEPPPLVVFFHGGGWRGGSYQQCGVRWLTREGFAVASVGYRLSDVATFPAQVHDCKAGVRWLRAHQEDYGYGAERVAVAGSSAGGHLALMLGVTSGDPELEGDIGGNLDQSSAVQAVVDYYGPSDFLLRSLNQSSKTDSPNGSVALLLGGPVRENKDLARLASPAFHVTESSPPLLIFHGDQDRVVYVDQAQRMAEAYHEAGCDAELVVIPGAEHGGPEFTSPERREQVVAFLNKHLGAE